jgi:hypothetical protein
MIIQLFRIWIGIAEIYSEISMVYRFHVTAL